MQIDFLKVTLFYTRKEKNIENLFFIRVAKENMNIFLKCKNLKMDLL